MTAPRERPLGRVGRIVMAVVLAISFVAIIVADDPSGTVLYAAFAGTGTFLALRRPATCATVWLREGTEDVR